MVCTRAGARGEGQTRAVFRFMDLPPELRVRIYELVLPGKILHVSWPWPQPISACQAAVSDEEWAKNCMTSRSTSPMHKGFNSIGSNYRRHSHCIAAPFGGRELSVLSVCRQIYKEAALTHIKDSIFVCSSPENIRKLCGMLTTLQQAAVTALKLVQQDGTGFWFIPAVLLHSKSAARIRHVQRPLQDTAKLLTGLKYMKVYAELVTDDFISSMDPNGEDGVATVRGQDLKFQALQAFRDLPLRSVDVVICNVSVNTDEQSLSRISKMPTQADLCAWEMRVTHMIMPDSREG